MKPDEDEVKQTLSAGEVLLDELDGTRFEARDLIGRGGMGEVYRATRLSDGAPCALKCVRGDLVRSPTILLRTRFEAQAFREIEHPNVVRVLGTGIRADNVPWMAMEWLAGFTLQEILEKRGKIPLRWAIEIVRDLCLGTHAIHRYAVHRDIKPANVHFGLDARTKVLDLGAAKSKEANIHLTTTGYQVGTMPYMAPEQLDNTMPVDHRADVWAAVVVLFILMTGVHPFALAGILPANKIVLGYRILSDPHLPLLSVLRDAPPFFGQIIDRGLAKDPENRHRSAAELAQVLTAALDYLEATTGHAEPLSSLVAQLCSDAAPRVIEPPSLLRTLPTMVPTETRHAPVPAVLWTPPRHTEPMPPPAPKSPPPEAQEMVSVVWSPPRNTDPMPAPAPRSVPEQPAPAQPAPVLPAPISTTEALATYESTDRHARLTVLPASSTPALSAAPDEEVHAGAEDADVERPTSDVFLKRSPDPRSPDPKQAERAPHSPPAARVDAGIVTAPQMPVVDEARRAPPAPPVARVDAGLVTAQPMPRVDAASRAPEDDNPPPEQLRQAPWWLVALMAASAVASTSVAVYYLGEPWGSVSPPPGPIEVPFVPLPELPDEPVPAAASAAPATASAELPAPARKPPVAAPRTMPRPSRPPAAPPAAKSAAPAPTTASRRLFDVQN